ncbi:hypothetical protein [Mycobacterium noviomagense]|nr:hypothetical protein [Mycobacterium noviomagense]
MGVVPSTAVTPQLMIAVLGTDGLSADGDTTASDTPGVIDLGCRPRNL